MNKKSIFSAIGLLVLSTVNAQFNNALHFDGTNDYVTAPIPALFGSISTASFTIEFKVKPEAFSTNRVFYLQTSNTNFVSVMLNSTGKVYFYAPNIGIVTSNGLPINDWTHVSIVKSGSTAEIYFDGVLQSTNNGGATSYSSVNLLGIGAKPDGSQYFKGVIDEFRIWNSLRTISEITTNMSSELTLPQTDLVTYYKFNQGIAHGNNPNETSLIDNVNSSNGTLNNFALSGTTSNWVGSLQLGLEDAVVAKTGLKIVPNPVKGEVNVHGLLTKEKYTITSSMGQSIDSGEITKDNNKINVYYLKPGVYSLNTGGQSIKFIKQ